MFVVGCSVELWLMSYCKQMRNCQRLVGPGFHFCLKEKNSNSLAPKTLTSVVGASSEGKVVGLNPSQEPKTEEKLVVRTILGVKAPSCELAASTDGITIKRSSLRLLLTKETKLNKSLEDHKQRMKR